MLVSRLRLALARRPWLHWLIATACGAVLWWQVAAAQASLHRAAAAWGSTRAVWVATESAPAGGPLTLAERRYPTAMVPADAVQAAPTTPVAARAVVAGAVLVPADLAGSRTVPAGWAVFALPGADAPELRPGDPAGLYADGQQLCEGRATEHGTDNGADRVEVAVPATCAPLLSDRLANGRVVASRISE